jgi:hypothetical protein
MKIVYAHEHPVSLPEHSIFLAGPSPREPSDYNWRPEALSILKKMEYPGTVYVPLPRSGEWLSDYDAQVDWELQYLEASRVIVFWVPRDLKHLPGFTTNIEFGLFVRSGKVVLGYPENAPKMRYLHRLADKYKVPVCCGTPDNRLWCTLLTAAKLGDRLS